MSYVQTLISNVHILKSNVLSAEDPFSWSLTLKKLHLVFVLMASEIACMPHPGLLMHGPDSNFHKWHQLGGYQPDVNQTEIRSWR